TGGCARPDCRPEESYKSADCTRVAARPKAMDRTHSWNHEIASPQRESRRSGHGTDCERSEDHSRSDLRNRCSRRSIPCSPSESCKSLATCNNARDWREKCKRYFKEKPCKNVP